jgi:heat shock protein HslJ
MPRPNTVEVVVDGTTLEGCGGDPAALLHGQLWTVQTIDGTKLAEGSRVTMSFGQDGRVSGNSSCNTYSGKYTLTGEGLTIGQAVSTRKACLPALMQQEATFLAILGRRASLRDGR